MYRWGTYLLLALCLGLLPAGLSVGQTTFGSITGTVTDPSGAVVPGAKVSVTNEGEGTVRQVTTGGAGVYAVPNLNVGTYRIRVSAAGFATYERAGLILSANEVLSADVHLALAKSAGTVVQVTGSGTPIATQTTNISNIKTSRDLLQLPSISRHAGDEGIYTYVLMNPGVSSVPGNSISNVQGVRQVTGVLPTMDGIAVMAYPIGPGPVQPSLEGVQEINVQLADTQAEFATPANIAVVTKSGTNQFHGGGFWDYNSGSLNARNYFSPTVPFRVYNDFGGSIGGPIKKNKTFFFADYEGSREAAKVVVTGNTALPAWRTGDFSGISTPIIDPLTGSAFPGNVIPSNRISPVSQAVQNFFYPEPNFGPAGLQSGNWRGQFPAQTGFTRFDNFDTRVDQNFSNGDKVFARFSYRRLPLTARENSLPPVGQRDQLRGSRSAVLSWTHLFSPTLLNEFRTGFTRQRNFYYPDLIGSSILQQVGIHGVSTTGIHDVPAFYITGLTTTDQPNPKALTLDTDFEWTDDLSWARGRHFMKFGFDAIRDQLGGYNYPNSIYGQYNFTGVYTGFAYADFLLGIPQTTQLTVPTPPRYLRGTIWSMYAQDQFKVNQRLTANYGVRWELDGPYYDRYGSIANFDPATGGWVVPDSGLPHVNPLYPKSVPITSASKAGYPGKALVDYPAHNIYPRAGIAYQPFHDEKTVIRAAYGIYSNLIYGSLGRALGGGPFSGSTTYVNALSSGVPLFSFPTPFLPTGTTSTQNAFGINPNIVTPYTQQWNATVERQLGSSGALRLSYVGSRSVNLIYARNLNQPPPSTNLFKVAERPFPIFNAITYYDNGAGQNYNGLEAAVAKNYGKNLTFNAGWTWAKDLTDAQDTAGFSGPTIQNQFNRAAEYGNNQITPTHRFYGYAVYQLPFGHGQRFLKTNSGLAQAVLGGWQMAWNVVLQSGQFYTPSFSGFDPSNTDSFGGRPDVVSGASSSAAGTQSIDNWFNPAAFKIPGCPDNSPFCTKPTNIGRFGNAGIGTLRGPAIRDADFSLSKFFTLRENTRLQFRMMMVNAFNHPNFSLPSANISSPATVARITSQAAPTFGTVAPREIDFQLRLEF